MGLIICEGLDRVGKTSVANFFQDKGYEVIHMSVPPKGQTADLFLEEMMELIQRAATQDIFLDRSYYGEACVWPSIYSRKPLIDEDGLEVLRELENAVGVERILMYDPNSEAHWQRCVENKEPLTKPQFVKARAAFSSMADKYEFQRKTLKDFPNAVQPLPPGPKPVDLLPGETDSKSATTSNQAASDKTREQLKLERANAINEVLSKRILKGKGPMYDELERSVRHFLNGELGKIFGNGASPAQGFSNDEVEILRFFCKKLKEKDNG